jgi:hypothetical protein
MVVFWDTAQCSLGELYRCSGGAYCLHHQGDCFRNHVKPSLLGPIERSISISGTADGDTFQSPKRRVF